MKTQMITLLAFLGCILCIHQVDACVRQMTNSGVRAWTVCTKTKKTEPFHDALITGSEEYTPFVKPEILLNKNQETNRLTTVRIKTILQPFVNNEYPDMLDLVAKIDNSIDLRKNRSIGRIKKQFPWAIEWFYGVKDDKGKPKL